MIDAHVHLWRIGQHDCTWPGADLPDIHRDFTLDDLLPEMDACGVTSAILVQSQPSETDTLWLLGLAAGAPRVEGVVGWTDLTAPAAARRIAHLAAQGPLLGFRPMMQNEPASCYDDPAMQAGLDGMAERQLVFDALVRPLHFPSLLRLARRNPDLAIVIDHCGKPVPQDFDGWAEAMRDLAACPNIACKLSGLLTELEADAPADAVLPWIEVALTCFGPDRLLWGSDWPVLNLAGSYAGWHALAWDAVPAADRTAIFGGNAARIYRRVSPA